MVAAVRILFVVQGVAHHRDHRLDGRDALSAAAFRLSLQRRRSARRSPKPSRSWSAACSMPSSIRPWSRPGCSASGSPTMAGFSAAAGCTPSWRWCWRSPAMHGLMVRLGARFRRRPEPALGEVLSDYQRGTDPADDRHRAPGGAQAVLTARDRGQPLASGTCVSARHFICLEYLPRRRQMPLSTGPGYGNRPSIGPKASRPPPKTCELPPP